MVLVCPPSRSQFKVYVSLTIVTCLFSTKEMRWLKEGQVEGRKWFLCGSGPESQVTCLLKSECMDVKWPPIMAAMGQRLDSCLNTEILFGFTRSDCIPSKLITLVSLTMSVLSVLLI